MSLQPNNPVPNRAEPNGFAADCLLNHALFWLALAAVIGVVLAAQLIWPGWSIGAGLTYGKLMPLHTNFNLFGWCGLGLVGLLFAMYPKTMAAEMGPAVRIWIWLWSGALGLGGLSWLTGHSTGKIFLDWTGLSKWFFLVIMVGLWLILGLAALLDVKGKPLRKALCSWRLWLWPTLILAPLGMALATQTHRYPPINPDSGGATGTSLFGSTLSVVFMFLLLPGLLRRPNSGGKIQRLVWSVFGIQIAAFALLNHHHVSNKDPKQVLALASLGIWIPLLASFYGRVTWKPALRRWLRSLAWWGLLLWINGLVIFLPGVLVNAKFTQVLVGHAHLAMAGFSSSFLVVVFGHLSSRGEEVFRGGAGFWLWNLSVNALVFCLTGLGVVEIFGQHGAFSAAPIAKALLFGRLLAGLAMCGAAVFWWLRSASPVASTDPRGNFIQQRWKGYEAVQS